MIMAGNGMDYRNMNLYATFDKNDSHLYPLGVIRDFEIYTNSIAIPEMHINVDIVKRDLKPLDRDVTNVVISRNLNGYIENVIFNDPATIVMWRDGSKTVVKAKNEPFDKEKGLAMAIAKKAFGNKGNYYKAFDKWIGEENGKETTEEDETTMKEEVLNEQR